MRRLSAVLAAVCLGDSATALALRIDNGDHPIQLDFTEDAVVDYHFTHGNGNIAPPTDPNYDPTSDNYLDWFNRFEAQLTTGPWHADLRFDSALFLNTPQISNLTSVEGQHFAQLLQNRYIDNLVLEKISASYLSPHLEATVGDFHLSYGRGIVLSLLKIDSLGVDTTLRGATVTARAGGFSANAAAGVTNVVNTDTATGSVAPDPEDRVVAGRLEYRLAQLFAVGVDGAVVWQNASTLALHPYDPRTTPTLVPISQLGPLPFSLGSVGTLPSSQLQFVPVPQRTENFSATVDLPNLWGHGNAYAEFAHQFQDTYNTQTQGNAFYAGVNAFFGDFTIQAELKDYLLYSFPTASSLSSEAALAFYQQDVYSNPPNLEEIWQEEQAGGGSPGHTYGPRVRLDWQATEQVKPFAAASYFVDDQNQYDIYNGLVGVEANWHEKHEHLSVTGGYRREVFNGQSTVEGLIHATEFWLQFDLLQSLSMLPGYAIELDGLIRAHRDYVLEVDYHTWNQSYAYLSLRHTRWSGSVGFESYTYAPSLYQPNNFNVSGSYTVNENLLLRGFVGNREAGLRCINGVCRNFPGFNGATLEVVARY